MSDTYEQLTEAEWRMIPGNRHKHNIEYQKYCGELFNQFLIKKLTQYKERNNALIEKLNAVDLFKFIDHFEETYKGGCRDEIGDEKFDAGLHISGLINGLYMELSKDNIDADIIEKYFTGIRKYKPAYEQPNKPKPPLILKSPNPEPNTKN